MIMTKRRCIEIINMWLATIEVAAIDGELKLTKKGTALLTDNLEWIRKYLIESEDE